MINKILIRVFEVVGSPFCVASEDGQVVHDQIAAALSEGKQVQLSFLNVESLTSAFLNSAVGQLYSNFSEDAIRAALSVTDIPPDDAALLKRVVDTAKQYFSNPARFREATEEVLGVE